MAQGGTLFLDEIGNLNLNLQAKLLSVIQSKTVHMVGSSEPVQIDTRLICATNKILDKEYKKGSFRQDLLYRINTVEINLPPLRKRPQDIPGLIRHFLNIYSKKYNKENISISFETIEGLMDYQWPGNIRELRHAVERAVIMCREKDYQVEDFLPGRSDPLLSEEDDSITMTDIEKIAIRNALLKNPGNLSKAAEELGIGRTTLYRKIKKFRLTASS
jgi:transcriptional regulator with PAS, ATPase and Fis domain